MIIREASYFIAHNGVNVFHYGFCAEETSLDTGQPILEQFATAELWKARYLELTGNELVE